MSRKPRGNRLYPTELERKKNTRNSRGYPRLFCLAPPRAPTEQGTARHSRQNRAARRSERPAGAQCTSPPFQNRCSPHVFKTKKRSRRAAGPVRKHTLRGGSGACQQSKRRQSQSRVTNAKCPKGPSVCGGSGNVGQAGVRSPRLSA